MPQYPSPKAHTTNQAPTSNSEYSTQCYCGTLIPTGTSTSETGCTMACAGASGEMCGGSSRLSVYQSTSQAPPVLVNSTSIGVGNNNNNNTTQTFFQGCFQDSSTDRTLAAYTFTSSTNMTVENCISGCRAKGYAVSGVEYGTECYCGNSVPDTSLLTTTASCEIMMCSGNTTEFCADGSRLAVYM